MTELIAGRYRAQTLLHGTTWLGRDEATGRRVVLRFGEHSPGRWLRLVHEAEALKALGGLEHLDRHVLVRAWVEGPTLAERLQAGPLSPDDARSVARAILHARYHDHGLLHGDLKPANIVLGPPLQLIDSGLDGTPLYLAPEAAGTLRTHRTGPATDLYALGITLYEMLTGHPPFQPKDLSELLRLHLTAPPPATGHPRIDAILQRLLAKSPDERYQTAEAVAHDLEHLPAVPGATDRRVTLAAPALVGRQAELERLERSAEQRRLILLQAPPGGGKTRLLDELQQRTKSWCLRGRAATDTAPAPLGLFASVAREAVGRRDLGPLGGVLAEVYPELQGVVSQPSLRAEGAAAAALAELLEALGPEALVLLDDVQWADPSSLEAVARWARVPGAGATVVVACRTGQLPRPLGHHEEIVLPPLSRPELRALWESVAGPAGGAELARLETLCEGNPFLAVEGLRGLRATGELTSARGSALLERRLESLTPATRELLARAALVGKSFPLEWLMLSEGASAALDEARRANLLWIGERTAEFAHDRLRDALLATLPDPVVVHRQAAEWFRRQGDTRAQAYHAHASGDPGAGPLALEVARELRARGALGEALQFYEMVPPDPEVTLETGEVQAALGRQDEARRHYEDILAGRPDAWLRARTLLRLGELEYRQSRFGRSLAWLEEALRVLGMPRARWSVLAPAPAEERFAQLALRIYVQLSATLMHEGKDPLGFLAVMLTAAHLTRRYPNYPEAGVLMGQVAAGLSFVGQTRRANAVVARALRAAPQPSLERAQVLSRACVPGLHERDPRQAQRYLQQAIGLFESLADEWELNMARFLLGRLYVAEGRLEDARQLARAILRTSAQANVQSHVWPARALLAQCGEAEDWPPADVDNCVADCFRAVALAFRQLCLGNVREAHRILTEFRPQPLLVDADHVAVLVWTATAARLCAEQTPFEAGAERELYYRQARRAVRGALKKARYFRCHLPHALREAALLAQARGHDLRARRLLAESLEEAEHYPLETERTRRLGYDFPPPPAAPAPAPVLQRLVEWSRRILTSSTREAVREQLAGAHAELRPDEQVARHLEELADTAYANLREEEVRAEASRRLEEGRQRLHAVLESAGVALALFTREGQVLAQNSLFAELPAQGFLARLLAAPEGLAEEDQHGQWCARWSAAGAVVTVTPARADRWEALARFQEAERRLLDERLGELVRGLAGYPALLASLDSMHIALRAEGRDDDSAPGTAHLAERLEDLAGGTELVLTLPGELMMGDLSRLALERILCEGVHNSVRHGRPTRLEISVREVGGWIEARLADDGRGFGPESESGRRGLKGMRWRAELAGGALEVRSSERGTILDLRLPSRY